MLCDFVICQSDTTPIDKNIMFVHRTFSATICGKMIAMLSGLATPVEMKMKLIPSLRHMHHDADTAAKVHSLLSFFQFSPLFVGGGGLATVLL